MKALAGPKLRAEFGEMVIRRARKQHRCRTMGSYSRHERERLRGWDGGPVPAEHSGTIAVGESYVEYLGESPPYESGVRYCYACSVAAGLIAK